jgi:hypothetical protein
MTNSFDHLLREALKGTASPAGRCLDAEVLAAWSEGTLETTARAAAEAHAAECSRCQALLATMIRIDPPIQTRTWWRSPALGWLAPLTVAGAALAIWVSVDRTSMPNEAASVVLTPPATSPVPEAQAGGQAEVGKARAPVSVRPAPPPAGFEARRADSTAKNEVARSVPPVLAEPLRDAVGAPADEAAMRRAAAAAAAPLPQAPVATTVTTANPAASGPPAPLAAAPAPSRSADTAPATERARAESATADAVGRLATGLVERNVLIRSADGQARWRITASGRLQRSDDGGLSWMEQDTGHTGILTGGAAVSDTVCWLVGRAGVVLLSTDGRSWRRVSFPAAVDLVSVLASDSKAATVIAAGGRRFTTTDGGVTWR